MLNYGDDYFFQEYGPNDEAFRALTNDDILKPYISDNDFGTSNDDNYIGCNLHVFDIRYQKILETDQPNKKEFNISENVPTGIYGYALVLTNKLVGIRSDGQHQFNLI